MKQQLLPVSLNVEMLFENWQITQNTQTLFHTLQKTTTPQVIYLYGATGLGKTHLLQAIVHQALNNNQNTIYLDLQHSLKTDSWQQLDSLDIICLDNIDTLDLAQQHLLFALYNKVKTHHLCLIVSAKVPPNLLNYGLIDLKTRLNLSLVFCLTPYNDEDLKMILIANIKEQNLLINDNIFNYLLKTCDRDLSHLLKTIEKIKLYVMENKQKISLPLVKKIIPLV